MQENVGNRDLHISGGAGGASMVPLPDRGGMALTCLARGARNVYSRALALSAVRSCVLGMLTSTHASGIDHSTKVLVTKSTSRTRMLNVVAPDKDEILKIIAFQCLKMIPSSVSIF